MCQETESNIMTSPDPKIIDLIKERCGQGEAVTSLEYFPPRTEEGVKVRLIPGITLVEANSESLDGFLT